MRYYCKNCKTEFIVGNNRIKWSFCAVCDCNNIENIPDYETPEQYKKRTGEYLHPETLLFQKGFSDEGEKANWNIITYRMAKEMGYNCVYIANPPVSPPNDWEAL